MKRSHIWISVIAVLVFGFLLFGDALARVAWEKHKFADLSLALNFSDADLALGIGNYYFGQGAYNLDKAQKGFKEATRIEPKILWGHYQLARIYFVKGEYDEALLEINKELEANPENLRSLYVRGLINAYADKLPEAENDFRRFIAWAPKGWAGYNDLAWILAKQGKYQEAKNILLAALSEIPRASDNPWILNSLGVAELNLKEYKNARGTFEKTKISLEKLSLKDWQAAYPGNNPEESASGLEDFKKAVDENLKRSLVDN
ncbi:hypothetical protein A3B18_00285 [Candidatus Giovannonibacteria bacterium RIFCSPLOWO2_01_FULL_46_13]|uniref:Uncharacterized protein n=1 Tax=Candidatus Giovannonibacteria bacterium RIFCSPLOWO2_01_FULL_46_13 TaxID=1798352 RepID=A0A1F5X4C6_9BACT|nr:MAG: hypothetical protein A3B18_00285 [Candidatus Giovannonibacteria bacterium RIFCSPLOWO2_01_FULL_46_13]